GKKAVVPLFNYEIPILADETVDLDKGTGLMMVCTFGDKEDVEKWHRFTLPLRIVFEKDGRMNSLAGEFKGLKITAARHKILETLQQQGYLVKQKEISHAVNVHERCKTEIEFLKMKQWYIKILDRKQELLEIANHITWYPEHMKVRYDHWVENLQWDWCISRQRHFGIPIPVWTCTSCKKHLVPDLKDLPVDPTSMKPKQKCSCGSTEFNGETDVLDTWATSSVTPEIAGNWIHQGEYSYHYDNKPFSLRPQAHDIIRTWLFYTVVKSLFHFGRVPWKKVMISGHAQDPHGRKMSKSVGNIVEPQEMIQKYSADALRFWAAGSKLGDDLPFQEKDLVTGQKFANKLWNASKFAIMHLEGYKHQTAPHLETFDQWLMSKLQRLIKESTETFENYEYSKTKSGVENFFWHTFCDQYLEIIKDRIYNAQQRGETARESAQYGLYTGILTVLTMMAPIMPHITEEIYQLYFAEKEGKKSIHLSSWPAFDAKHADDRVELIGDLGVDIINTVRKFKSENQLSLKEDLAELVLISEEKDFEEMISAIQNDLKAVLKVRTISFSGETSLESEKFSVTIGIKR
ncbi:MAG: class I tRNA ligase family protein, partial [Nanoarchaeota archaeon]|nr:class I tRNA ligase family protein [Nanoarchaeota archaeon]